MKMVDVGRRQFLRGGALAAAGAAVATVSPGQARAAPANAQIDYPSSKLANIADLTINEPMDIDYPDADSPGALASLTEALALHDVSVDKLLQDSADEAGASPVAIVSHTCSRGDIDAAAARVAGLETIIGAPQVIPIDAASE
ncbi:MAG: twin-arginine translocation signal domain-containing protein [Henriciella sp.]|nr:twin-arginine translocation signal domain-containing protein [Henriciella sp.]